MPKYFYKSVDMHGEVTKGHIEAQDRNRVFGMIRDNNQYPVEIYEWGSKKYFSSAKFIRKFNSKELFIFCGQFSALIKAGIPISHCLSMLASQKGNKLLAQAIEKLNQGLQKGKTLSEGMRIQDGRFPCILINTVEAGELSGTLDISMDSMAEYYEKDYGLMQKIKSGLAYPTLVCTAAAAAVFFLITQVIPGFITFFESNNVPLPLITRMIVQVGELFSKTGLAIIATFIIICGLIRMFTLEGKGRCLMDGLLLKLPLLGNLQTLIISARFTRALSTLVSAGIPLNLALNMTSRTVGNAAVEKGILEVEKQVGQGKSLEDALKLLDFLPPMVVQMTAVGEEAGTLDHMLVKTAEYYANEVESRVQMMAALLEPGMIIILGAIVGFIVLSVAMPMFDMMKYIGY